MINLFEQSENDALVNRLNQLQSKSQPKWGKMSVSQMLWHCQQPFEVAIGNLKLKKSWMGFFFGKIAKKQLLRDRPFPRNLPTIPKYKALKEYDFDTEKNKLIQLVQLLAQKGENCLIKEPHPFFGKMTPKEWNDLLAIHLDHHLLQFGV